MPEKEGAEEKSTKSVVNKKQKQMMGEEGYDIARDEGRVKPSKDKKDATSYPVSDEVKKTQKKNKGPSALELVKKKYGKAVMKVGKKKVKEELDLTQVAEAFGGYIIEAESGGKSKKNKNQNQNQNQNQESPPIRSGSTDSTAEFEKSFRRTRAFSQLNPDQKAGKFITRTQSLTRGSGFGPSERINPDDKKTQDTQNKVADQRIEIGKKQSDKAFTSTKTDTTVNPKDMVTDKEGNIIANAPDQTPEQKKRFKQTPEYQKNKKTGKTPLIDQDKFSTDTRTVDQDRVTKGRGDGRKAGRRGKSVTYTPQKKPKVTSVMDFGRKTDTRSSVDPVPTPKGPVQGPKKPIRDRNRVLQKVRVAARKTKRPVQRLVKPVGKLAARNPFAAAIVGTDLLDRVGRAIPKPSLPKMDVGVVGRRTAGQ